MPSESETDSDSDTELRKIRNVLGYARTRIYDVGLETDNKRDYSTLKRNIKGMTQYELAVEKRKMKTLQGILTAKNGQSLAIKSQRIQALFPLLSAIADSRMELELRKSTIGFSDELEKAINVLAMAEKAIASMQ
jgi:hypothetical protein